MDAHNKETARELSHTVTYVREERIRNGAKRSSVTHVISRPDPRELKTLNRTKLMPILSILCNYCEISLNIFYKERARVDFIVLRGA